MTFLETYSSPRKRTVLPALSLAVVTGLVGWYGFSPTEIPEQHLNTTAIQSMRTLATHPLHPVSEYANQETLLETWRGLPKADRYSLLKTFLEESTQDTLDQTRDTLEDHLGDLTVNFLGGQW